MADAPSRNLSLPLVLVGAIAAGALVPRLSPQGEPANGAKPQTTASSPAKPPSPDLASENDHQVLDLLADYFGVDISPSGLERRVKESAAAWNTGTDSAIRGEAAAVLRAFLCTDVRARPNGALPDAMSKAAAEYPLPPGCRRREPGQAIDVPAFVDQYFAQDALRDDLAARLNPTELRGGLLVQERRGLAKNFEAANREPLEWAVVEAAAVKHGAGLQFLVATVPDPIDSYETWQFDPDVDAIRQGIEASGYLFDRFHLPEMKSDSKSEKTSNSHGPDVHSDSPGIVLFRWGSNSPKPTDDESPLLVLFLVPETPVAGIDSEPFRRAVEFTANWITLHPRVPAPGGLRILGPSFSGSTPSIMRALHSLADVRRRIVDTRMGENYNTTFVTGSASSDSNRASLESVPGVRFRATMHSNAATDVAIEEFLARAGIRGDRAALSEASTAYGTQTRKGGDDDGHRESYAFKYPFNIAQLRSDANRDGSPKRDPAAGVVPGFRPLAFEDDTAPTDQLPLLAPRTTSSSVELVLSNLMDAIKRRDVRIVDVDATDVRDKLFLIKELRQRVQDVLLVTSDADLFQIHPDQAPWLKGVIVATTYPLHTSAQRYVYPYGPERAHPNGDLVQFPSANTQGMYNAAIALLNYEIDDSERSRPLPRFKDVGTVPRLIDYGGVAPGCPTLGEPALWISVVGEGQIVPLESSCNPEERFNQKVVDQGTSYVYGNPVDFRYVFRPLLDDMANEPPVSIYRISVSDSSMPLVGLLVGGAVFAGVWLLALRRRARPVEQEAVALALCGLLVPLAFLTVVLPVLTWHLRAAGDSKWMGWASIAVFCAIETIAAVGLQFTCTTRRYAWPRALFVAAAIAFLWYPFEQLGRAPQLFLQRTFDLTSMMSPFLAIVMFGMIPVIPACVELWRLKALGPTPPERGDTPVNWPACVADIFSWADLKRDGLMRELTGMYQSSFALPPGWWAMPTALTALTGATVFVMGRYPVLTFEGTLFGWAFVIFILVLQWVFAAAIVRLVHASCATARFLSSLHTSAAGLPYAEASHGGLAVGLVPKSPTLSDLAQLATLVPNGPAALKVDLEAEQPVRWFQGRTWAAVEAEMTRVSSGPARDTLAAISVVLLVRELFSRLAVNLYLIGPSLILLTLMYATVYVDRSHCLLGLVWVDVLTAMVVVMSAFVWMERDFVVSRIRNRAVGETAWNWDLTWKVLVYVALPLLTLFATQFPGLGSGLLRALGPVQRLPGQ